MCSTLRLTKLDVFYKKYFPGRDRTFDLASEGALGPGPDTLAYLAMSYQSFARLQLSPGCGLFTCLPGSEQLQDSYSFSSDSLS